jgi:hypothetical protein
VNKQQALYTVASHIAGLIQAGSFEEATGVRDDDVDGKDAERLHWAIGQVIDKLDTLGKPPAFEPPPRPRKPYVCPPCGRAMDNVFCPECNDATGIPNPAAVPPAPTRSS